MSTQGQIRDKVPRDIRAPGMMKNEAAVGRILSVELRPLNPSAASSPPAPSQAGAGAGAKGKTSTGKGKKGQPKGARAVSVLEIYLCGGGSPADVMLFEAWDAAVLGRLRSSAVPGQTVRIRRALVVAHTDKTRWYSTSRAPMFLKAVADTTMERIDDSDAYLAYHPVTPIPSIRLLPPRSLVCLAGRVVGTFAVAQVNTPDGEHDVPVAHLTVRAAGDALRVTFWRDTTQLLETVEEGALVFVQGAAKQFPKGGDNPQTHVELRAVARTKVAACPQLLADKLADTPANLEGARAWWPTTHEKMDYEGAAASWMSLSVLGALCSSNHVRTIEKVFQVPSVFMEIGSRLTYEGCSQCKKTWRDESLPPCACGAVRVALWRAKVGLRDATGHLQATCFDALGQAIRVYTQASGDTEHAAPADFSTDDMANKVASYISAVPFTARLTVTADGWTEALQATVQLLDPTFMPSGVLHPLKPLVQTGPSSGACLPFRLADTSYDEGVGMTLAAGHAFESFRGFVQLVDDPVDDVAEACVHRKIRCACGTGTSEQDVEFSGEACQVELLGRAAKDSHAHVLLAWRSGDAMSMIAFMPVQAEQQDAFRQFFEAEMKVCREAETSGPSLSPAFGDTPLRIMSAAELANVTSPPSWKARRTCARTCKE